ncbi:MAG: efflux RND transporter periplasmic adaptor subunit [Chloroflexi bacterium]|nr:efflux RND transporter periplasmic adaptor subunit [Chloroflexota bacterium]
MKFFNNRFNLIVGGLVLIALLAVAVFYFQNSANTAAAKTSVLQTAKVRTGDLVIIASGAGVVEPAVQVDLAFRSAGVLNDLNVQVGDQVTSAQVLARLEENLQAETDFQALFSAEGIAQAELALANAEDHLVDTTNTYIYSIGDEAWYWQGELENAEAALNALGAAATTSQKEEAQKLIDDARAHFDYYVSVQEIPAVDIALARANLESAKVALTDAQAALDIVTAGPAALKSSISIIGKETSRLESARLAVESTRLTAPFDGTAISVKVVEGQMVNTSPVMTIATTDKLFAHIYLDETDLEKVGVGKRVTITFDAYPNTPVEGEIVLVEPALQNVDGSSVVAAWATFAETNFTILSGMNLEAEVIAGEARDALIIPKQALRELEPGSFAVFVVAADGQLLLTPVEVGLMDYANAEILSGLQVGDVVSTGNVETK